MVLIAGHLIVNGRWRVFGNDLIDWFGLLGLLHWMLLTGKLLHGDS